MAAGWHVLREGSEPVPGYRLLEYLGGGSLGEVWRASGPGGTQVALKIVNLRRRGTLHEFRALEQVKNIRDPHLVPVVAYWLLDESGQVIADPASALLASGGPAPAGAAALPSGRPRAVTLIMAMGLGSKSLFERLEECVAEGHSGIPWKELLEYMEDAARGIDFLNQPSQHHESIIHGDIKPHNILIVGNAAQVCDFGLARAVDSIRATNMPVGTVAYAAPELLQSRPLHRNTDQYCLAVSYVELRTGALPFDAETVVGICEKHVKGQLDLSGLKPCERTVIARAVALDPDQRWPSCRDMVRALRLACEADESAGRLGPERLGSEIVPGCWLQEHLGQGSLGSSWKARCQDGSWLALKVLELNPAEAVAQVHALRAIRATRHERLLPILRLWVATEEGFVYEDRGEAAELAFLEPYATGVARPVKVVLGWELGARNLRAAFPRLGEASASLAAWRDVLHCLDDVAEGLAFIHSTSTGLAGTRRGPLAPAEGTAGPVVHGRLKPENVILVGHAAKIGDFGVHRALGLPVVAPTEDTAPGIAPEARTGKLVPASDQFALAICYVEIRTGQPAQPPAEKRDTLPPPSAPPVDLSGLPGDEERAVVARALAPRPEDRWPSCEAFVQHLRAACEADERRLQRPRRGAEAPGSEILPGYRLVEKLGQGQIGRVWKAVGRGGMLRALKIVDLRGRAGLKELRALEQVKGIRSGNLISVSSYWLVDREGFLLTDLPEEVASLVAGGKGPAARETTGFPAAELIIEMDLANKTLLQRLRECQQAGLPAIPVDELLRYMEQAAAGIDYLNQPEQRPDTPPIEIVHGDIKPQNIMIMGNTAAVGDFGLARIVQRLGIQQTGMGTPAYAAPELLRGLPHRTSDQYCLAMTYVELRTGRLPFDEPDAMAIARRHLEGRLDLDRAGLPPDELAVIRKATAMDPHDRYASCSEMVRALRRAVEGVFTLRARGPAPEEQFAGGQTLTALSSPGVQTGPTTLVAPVQGLGEAARKTPEGPSAGETQPAEPLGLPPLGQPAELEPTIVAWPTRSRPSRRWIAVAGGLVAVLALAAALAHPRVRQWVIAWLSGDRQPPVSTPVVKPPGVSGKPGNGAPSPGSKPAIPPPEPPPPGAPKVPTMPEPGPKLAELLERFREMLKSLIAEAGPLVRDARNLLEVVMALGNPHTRPAAQAEALAAAEKLLAKDAARLTPEQQRLLISVAGALRGTKDASVLARAIALVRDVCQRAPGRPELAAPLASLWQTRIAQQIGQREPTPAEFEEFQKDWALWERVPPEDKRRAAADLHLLDLWRLENLLLAGKSAEVPPPRPEGLPKEFEAYWHYLAARIHLAAGRVDEALHSLDRLFGQKPIAPAVGQVTGRLQRAIEGVVTAVQQARRLRPGKNRFEPYADGQEAKRHLHLLQAAQAAIASPRPPRPEPKKPPAVLDSPLEVQFQLALALAALAADDRRAAASATEALARLPVSELGHLRPDERLLAPYAYVVSHIPATPQGPLPAELRGPILQNAADLLGLLTDRHADPLRPDEAGKLYSTVIAPLLARSDQKWTASDERFLSSASEFLWSHLEDDWPAGRAKILEHLENALSGAIGLTGATIARDRPRYLMRRAQVRLAWQPPRLGDATADADAAIELDGRNPKVRGVHAEAHLLMSRTQDLRKARIDHLTKAMESAELAVRALRATEGEKPPAETPPKEPLPPSALATQRELPACMLTLSMARLEYANFASDNRQQYLDEAAKLAHDAARLIGQNDPRAATTYMALGNACEDLAWAAEQDPEKFYPEAIQAFNRANRLRQLPSAEALRSIGRCYYRAAVESVLDRLGGLDRTGMLQQAAQHLEQVTRQLDPQDAEAWYYLGLVYWNQDPANYAKAAGCFETARKVAIAQNRPDYAYYLLQWAVFPWNDRNLRGSPQWLESLRATITPRLDELEKAPVPAGAAIHPQREALHQRARFSAAEAQFSAAEEKWDEAIRLCEQALQQVPQPDWAEVYLLLDLAQYRLKQAGKLLQEGNTNEARQRAGQALDETQKAHAAAISLVQLANCQNVLGQVYTTRWMVGWDASDWDRAVAAYAEVLKLQPRRRIAQEGAGRIATLHLFRAMRDQPPTYETLKLLDNGIRWQQSAYESLRIHTGETPDQFTALRSSVKSDLQKRFIQPALEKAREVLNSETDPARRKQIEAWMAEWEKLAR